MRSLFILLGKFVSSVNFSSADFNVNKSSPKYFHVSSSFISNKQNWSDSNSIVLSNFFTTTSIGSLPYLPF